MSSSRKAVQFPTGDESDCCPSADDECSPTTATSTGSTSDDATVRFKNDRRKNVKEGGEEDSSDSGDDDEEDEVVKGGRDAWKEEDGKGISCECLICSHTTSGYEAADLMKEHLESEHQLSFQKLKTVLKLSYMGFVQFVRFARRNKNKSDELVNLVSKLEASNAAPKDYPWSSDEFLVPKEGDLEADYFLTLDYFEEPEPSTDSQDLEALRRELDARREQVKQMEVVFRRVVLEPWEEASSSKALKKSKKTSRIAGKSDNDLYFMSYDELTIHHEMIFDHPRTEAYRKAINEVRFLIKDSTVMDLGCGTAILSMFCALQGAKKVYAVENSEIIYEAMNNVFDNSLEKIIEFKRQDIDKEDLEIEKVDVIVSEFMGYFLFFEGMTETFIRARDKYLKKGGRLLPDAADVYLVPLGREGLYRSKVDCWDNVYGFKMQAMKDLTMKEIPINSVSPDETIGPAVCVKNLNLYTCSVDEIQIDEEFKFRIDDDTELCAIAGYFSVTFRGVKTPIVLSTSPEDPPTHWKQAIFFLPKRKRCTRGEEVPCRFKSYPHPENPRWLMVEITLDGVTHKYEFN
ncbi:Protein arginine N-methyltransferase 3 [Orchesella cincta]|uniref:type I protein arginine methyltransferase n=1 Tax=Orchesella cincta TaxID=48709 RepID=A0A1D2MBE8_ORCCI|nr:Protein arginine N-methyltransferase 3 [Orchesella cincta]